MVILKVLNNNAATTIDPDTNNEMVIMGRGLAFGKKSGDEIDKSRIEKIFTLDFATNYVIFASGICAMIGVALLMLAFNGNILKKKGLSIFLLTIQPIII